MKKSGRSARANERLHLILQYVMLLFCSCKHQQSKGRTASRTHTHREHGCLNCKHFNTQTHTQHCPSQSSTMTFHRNTHTQKASAKSIQAHTDTHCVHTFQVKPDTGASHTLHIKSVNYIASCSFLPPVQD